MVKSYQSSSLDDLGIIAKDILDNCKVSKIFAFSGNLGAGKTTLIKELCKQLNYTGDVTSPTFSIINQYDIGASKIYHMDLYRLKDEEEALEIGIEDYLYSGAYCFIEWPQFVINIIDTDFYSIEIEPLSQNIRKIDVRKLPILI